MKIILAKTAGFCFGVNRAVSMVYNLLDKEESVATLGPIIHNTQVVAELESRGVKTLSDLSQAQAGQTVVIRSHGVSKEVTDYFEENGFSVVDATCPFVSKIHKIVSEADSPVLIAGNKNHPEVQGIIGHCRTQCFVFANTVELEKILEENSFLKNTESGQHST